MHAQCACSCGVVPTIFFFCTGDKQTLRKQLSVYIEPHQFLDKYGGDDNFRLGPQVEVESGKGTQPEQAKSMDVCDKNNNNNDMIILIIFTIIMIPCHEVSNVFFLLIGFGLNFHVNTTKNRNGNNKKYSRLFFF